MATVRLFTETKKYAMLLYCRKIDELECDSELGPQVRRIKAIHEELFELRNIRDSHEREMRIKIFSVPSCQDSLLQYQRDIKVCMWSCHLLM